MKIDKLDLLAKGWNTSEIEQASKIIDEAENNKHTKIKFVDGLLLAVMVCIMLANGFVSSMLIASFIYVTTTNFIIILAAFIGLVFSILLTTIIYDIEKIHHKHETNLFIAFITSGAINFYLILEFTARFGRSSGLILTENVFIVAGTYLVAFLIPQAIYQIRKIKQKNIQN
ncbi:MAG: hypothetical protein ACP5N1_03470 [Candidatus Woesearchaeota archaeon]